MLELVTKILSLSCEVILISLTISGSIWRFCSQYPLEPLSYKGYDAVAPRFIRLVM